MEILSLGKFGPKNQNCQFKLKISFWSVIISKTESDNSNRRYMFTEWNSTLHIQYTLLLQNLQLAWQGEHIK